MPRAGGACLALALAAAGCLPAPTPVEDPFTRVEPAAASFLRAHWDRPLSPQGPAPPGWPAAEAILEPAGCAGCHATQFGDWARSRHALGMGPGVRGQWLPGDQGQLAAQGCLFCHAPLAEQAAAASGEESAASHLSGLTCAGCHVRGREVFGPPLRQDVEERPEAHGGFTVAEEFQDAGFCAACHQFDKSGLALAGKPLENTYNEWLASPAARAGKTCQHCHMPDRRHLWRGIHDADMVREAVAVTAELAPAPAGRVVASLSVINSGAGHHFPTYVTPRVILEACQVDAEGEELAGTCQEAWISREVTLDLSAERADTRIPAGESLEVSYGSARGEGAEALRVRLVVDPDQFYREFFASFLAAGRGDLDLMREAHREAAASAFVSHEMALPLPPAG